jgi:hypothetical protein
MRATLLCLTAIMLGSLLVIPTVAFALDYKARAWEHHGGQSRILAESQGPTPPQSVQGSWMLNDDWAHHMAYFSDMDRGQYKFHLSVVAMRRNGWFAVGGDATWNDLIFECDDGRASVDVIANLRIKGDVNFRDWGGQFELGFGAYQGWKKAWRTNNTAVPPPSTSPFTGVTGQSIDGVFAIPISYTPLSTGVPNTVSLGYKGTGDVYGQFNMGYGWATADFSSGDNGISFPMDGPAFDLPEGCTCNSVEANIVDNVWQGVEVAPATVTISGTITSDCDGPLAGITVVVIDGDGNFSCTETTCVVTGGQGLYTVSGIAASTSPGTVEVIAPPGYTAPEPISVPLDADQTVDAELTCVYTSVSGTVESGCGGGPLSGATVTLTPHDGTPLSTATAVDGSFSFSDLRASNIVAELTVDPPAGYDAFPAEPGTAESMIDITSDQTGVVVALVCQVGSVAGNVTADCPALGTPLDGVQVDVYETGSGTPVGSAQTDVNGAYAIDGLLVPVGVYTITVMPPAGYEASANDIAVTVVAGEAATANFPLSCLPGSVVGRVTVALSSGGNCPAVGSGVYGVEVDAYEMGTGNLVATGVTDENGDYVMDELTPRDYTIVVNRPLSLSLISGTSNVAVTVPPGETATADFPSFGCFDSSPRAEGAGYWGRRVAWGVAGDPWYQPAMCTGLDRIENHFNSNAITPVVVYEPPASGGCEDKLLVAKDLLNLRGRQTMTARAKRHFMALLFNVAYSKLQLFDVISADGATVSQAITYVDNLIDDPAGDHETAKDICEIINNGDEIPAGVIPLSTADIAYSPGIEEIPSTEELSLGQNYPNPFNPTTNIQFVVDQAQFVELSIFNATGRLVRTLVSGQREPGTYVEAWDARDSVGREVSTGIYFYRLKTGQATLTRKMILLK